MAQRIGNAADITWLVEDLVARVPHVEQAVVLSHDGLLLAQSSTLTREDADHLCAVAAGLYSLARGAGRRFGRGEVRQTMVEMEGGFLFVTAGGSGACLAVLGAEQIDVGVVAYEMEMLVARVGTYLSAPARSAVAGGGGVQSVPAARVEA